MNRIQQSVAITLLLAPVIAFSAGDAATGQNSASDMDGERQNSSETEHGNEAAPMGDKGEKLHMLRFPFLWSALAGPHLKPGIDEHVH